MRGTPEKIKAYMQGYYQRNKERCRERCNLTICGDQEILDPGKFELLP